MNKPPHIVRESPDPRVVRTHHALTHAMIALVHEKGWNAMTVQDLADRAGVGRTTFYTHYRGKEDLLVRSFEQLLRMLDGGIASNPERLAPVRELFAHVGESRAFHRALVRGKVIDRLYRAGTDCLSETIERRLPAAPGEVPRDIEARAHAGALFALLRWWLEQDRPHPPEHMDRLFHTLAKRPV